MTQAAGAISDTHPDTLHLDLPPGGTGERAPATRKGKFGSFVETTKPGITKLVTATSMVGLLMAGAQRGTPLLHMAGIGVACAIGTALSASGANAINQYMERSRDALMPRTLKRPLPQGRISPATVLWGGIACCVLGLGVLAAFCGAVPSLVSLACIVSYVAFYTPMKTWTTLSTLVGAIPGALPPLIGWSTGSNGTVESLVHPGALSLFVFMAVWQIPHFLAIGWLYRDDYTKGGYVLLPVIDKDGSLTSLTIGLWTAALVPASILPAITLPGLLGWPYVLIAATTGVVFSILAWRLISGRSRPHARTLFFGSIIHLPVLLMAMTAETAARSALL